IVTDRLPGNDPARFDIAAIEREIRSRLTRQLRLGLVDVIVTALYQQIPPIDTDLATINTDILNREVPGADEPVHVDPQLGTVLQIDCSPAYSWRAARVDVRMEHVLTGEIQVDVPILVIIGPSSQPSDRANLFTVEQTATLRSISGTGRGPSREPSVGR